MCSLYVDVRDWGKKNLLFITDSLAAALFTNLFLLCDSEGNEHFLNTKNFLLPYSQLLKTAKNWAHLQFYYFISVSKFNK